MSDPFADLLSSFKGDSAQVSGQSTKNSSLNELLDRNTPVMTPSPTPSSWRDNISKSTVERKKQLHNDLLDDFLGQDSKLVNPLVRDSNGQSDVVVNNTQTLPKDDLDMVFEAFHSSASSLKPEVHSSQGGVISESAENVVDEVKDMEIAQLMSLGVSLGKAIEYYERGILYDDLVSRRKHDRKEIDNKNYGLLFDERQSKTFNVSSLASNLFSMGKDFIEDTLKPKERLEAAKNSFSSEITSRSQRKGDSFNQEYHAASLASEFAPLSLAGQLPNKEGSPITIQKERSSIPERTHQHSNRQDSTLAPIATASITPEKSAEETLLDFDGDHSVSEGVQGRLSAMEMESFTEFKEKGIRLFKAGNYHGALSEFEKSLNCLPREHPLRIVSLSNIIACQSKLGEHINGLKSIDLALGLLGSNIYSDVVIENTSPQKTYRQMATKIQIKHAEIQENMENYENALKIYSELLNNNVLGTNVLDGKRRCERIVYPEKFKAKPYVNNNKPPLPSNSCQSAPIANSIAVKMVKEQNKNIMKIEDERYRLHETVEQKIHVWSSGHEFDLRYLLSNLDSLLQWTEWKSVSSSDLVLPKKVKICYLKAISRTHPDKLPSNIKTENIMIAENVFMILNKAWEKFKVENHM